MSGAGTSVETVVIGAGHSGLIASWHLGQAGREHIVLELRPTLGGGWQDRWDAFCLVTPNELVGLPGFPYDGPDPDGFLPRDEIVARTAAYAGVIGADVRTGVKVHHLEGIEGHGAARFRLRTTTGEFHARNVVMAVGAFQRPKIPAAGAQLPPRIAQLHSHDYRRPADLPPGGVLVVGTGQTGAQLAEELFAAGREVVLSVGHCGRVPRRYRGRDFFHWMRQVLEHGHGVGIDLPTVDRLPDPRARFACNPHLSGHDGGHDTDLREFAERGIRLAGRFEGADGERARFASDLDANLAYVDGFFDERFRSMFDRYIERAGIDALPADAPHWSTHEPPELTELDLAAEGISTVLWTSGYAADYGWLGFPILDGSGLPRHVRGVTEVPGLTALGLLWQHNQGSANLAGVAMDAEYLSRHWT
jgi:putative flavoprotein involved in K+ transport